jgi:tetratricopeptide (TPR) repeat protein
VVERGDVFRLKRRPSRRAIVVIGVVIVAVIAVIAIGWRAVFQTTPGPTGRAGSAPGTTTAPAADIASLTRSGHPVIFLGLDAGDWGLLDQYMARGVMPNLARLAAEGVSGRLKTIEPPLSPLIWTTMMTGVSPLDHGILDFVQFDPDTGQKQPIGSIARRAPAIWNMASAAGKRAGVFGLWATYPAESIDGLMVSDRLFTFLFKESTPPERVVFPASEEAWARETLARAEQTTDYAAVKSYLPWLGESEYRRVVDTAEPYGHPVSALRRILVETMVYRDLSLDWIRRARPDLAVVYIQGTDTIGHVFAPYAPPRQPEVDAREYERYHTVPEQYFRSIDAALGEYRKAADAQDAVLMIASDHGFVWGEGRPTKLSSVATATAARWHSREGIYLLHGRGIAARAGHEASGSVEQVAATLLALMGLPPGRDVNGDPLPGAQPTGAPHADYVAHYRPSSAPKPDAKGGAVDQEALANLRSLGYIGTSESSVAPASARGSTRSAGSYNNEGIIHKGRERLPQATEAFEKALTLDPNLVSAQWNLSDVLYSRGQDLDRSDALLARAFAGGLPEGNRFLLGRAIAYQRNKQTERSLTLIDAALAAKPTDAELWLFRGRYRVDAADCAGAAQDFTRAVSLEPNNPAAHASLGLARLCQNDRASARQAFERSLKLDPNQPKIREYLKR